MKFFLFFKNYFWHQNIKTIWNHKKIILSKKQNSKFEETRFALRSQTHSECGRLNWIDFNVLMMLRVLKLVVNIIIRIAKNLVEKGMWGREK
jgi:L-cysteine desulfidase